MKPEWIRILADNAHQLKVGDRLKELLDFGGLVYSIIVSTPHQNGAQWTWDAAIVVGGKIEYMITGGYESYGPHVYVARGEEDEPEQTNTDTGVTTNKQEPVTV